LDSDRVNLPYISYGMVMCAEVFTRPAIRSLFSVWHNEERLIVRLRED